MFVNSMITELIMHFLMYGYVHLTQQTGCPMLLSDSVKVVM